MAKQIADQVKPGQSLFVYIPVLPDTWSVSAQKHEWNAFKARYVVANATPFNEDADKPPIVDEFDERFHPDVGHYNLSNIFQGTAPIPTAEEAEDLGPSGAGGRATPPGVYQPVASDPYVDPFETPKDVE